MRIGLTIPTRGPLANATCVKPIAVKAEQLGFAHFAVPDHIVVPTAIDSTYPYSETGAYPGQESGECLEQFNLLAYLAGISEKPQLLTSVTVIPHRGAVHTAKTVASIDVLSNGRMVLGVGTGWMREEFEALDAPAFEHRGRVTDEYLEAFKQLWTQDRPSMNTEHVKFSNIQFLPKPVRKPHPPIWVGGESKPALRRTAKYGDVWFPIGTNPRHPLNTITLLKSRIVDLHEMAEKHDRDPSSIGLAYFCNAFNETAPAVTLDGGERHLLTGPAEAIAEDIDALAQLGFTDLVMNFQRDNLDGTLHSMDHFCNEIRSPAA